MKGKSKYERIQVKPTDHRGTIMVALVFASGIAGLIYQVLWMKQLGLLFGNTSHAAAATLAAFFAGLGAGSWDVKRGCSHAAKVLFFGKALYLGVTGSSDFSPHEKSA